MRDRRGYVHRVVLLVAVIDLYHNDDTVEEKEDVMMMMIRCCCCCCCCCCCYDYCCCQACLCCNLVSFGLILGFFGFFVIISLFPISDSFWGVSVVIINGFCFYIVCFLPLSLSSFLTARARNTSADCEYQLKCFVHLLI